jgi:hypothetical protein
VVDIYMSEATLKRKTKAKYNNMSVGSTNGGFSLNGTRRSAGYVGQDVLGRSFPRTPMRGNEARGSGGCCGTYRRTTIVQSGVCFPSGSGGNSANNDPRVVKKSGLDTNGRIMTGFRWIRRPQPYAVVKPDSNMIQQSQQFYIENLAKNTVATLNACDTTDVCKSYVNTCGGLSVDQRPRPFGTVIRVPRKWYSITKTADNTSKLGPISQGAFIKALGGLCQLNNVLPKAPDCACALPGPGASY